MLTGLSWYRWVFVEISGMDESIFSSCSCLLTLQYLNQVLFFEVMLWILSDKVRLLHLGVDLEENTWSLRTPLLRKVTETKIRPTRIGVGRVSLSHTSSRAAPKSCFGFVGGRDGCWLSSRVLDIHPKAHFLRELFLTVFLSETNVEERFSLLVA